MDDSALIEHPLYVVPVLFLEKIAQFVFQVVNKHLLSIYLFGANQSMEGMAQRRKCRQGVCDELQEGAGTM